jgi:hypothetical protein
MKVSKSSVHWKSPAIPKVEFEEDQQLTSFSGLVIFQELFSRLNLKSRLKKCFEHLQVSSIFGQSTIMMILIVHLLLGYRRLQDLRYYSDDPMVKRVLGLKRLPDVATVSRALKLMDQDSVLNERALNRAIVRERLEAIRPARVTLDFDGSVSGTGKKAEGTAAGYNKKKKGQRSYYPLFCTIAQLGQVFDVWHRPGNVHDSNGAREFISACIAEIRASLPGVIIEVRMDSAFFSDEIVSALDALEVKYSISVPFERWAILKAKIKKRQFWHRADRDTHFFQCWWKPKSWDKKRRFVFVRTLERKQRKGVLQLDLFEPHDYDFKYKVILSNQNLSARKLVAYHNGRGAQEGLFAELKSHAQMDYIPTRRLAGNQTYLMAVIMAHNLNRELQMSSFEPDRSTTEQRQPWWKFVRLETLRRTIIQRAGRLIRPQGSLTLKLSVNPQVQDEILHYLQAAA